jgi:hypothetical protein
VTEFGLFMLPVPGDGSAWLLGGVSRFLQSSHDDRTLVPRKYPRGVRHMHVKNDRIDGDSRARSNSDGVCRKFSNMLGDGDKGDWEQQACYHYSRQAKVYMSRLSQGKRLLDIAQAKDLTSASVAFPALTRRLASSWKTSLILPASLTPFSLLVNAASSSLSILVMIRSTSFRALST